MTPAEVGVILVVLSVMAYLFGHFRRARVGAVFVGIILMGTGGHLTHLFSFVLVFVQDLFGRAVTWAFGVTTAGLLAIVLGYWVFQAMGKKGNATRATYWAAAALAILIVTGTSGITALDQLPGSTTSVVQNTQTNLGG